MDMLCNLKVMFFFTFLRTLMTVSSMTTPHFRPYQKKNHLEVGFAHPLYFSTTEVKGSIMCPLFTCEQAKAPAYNEHLN